MANPNIFASLLRPVKSVAEYDADYDVAEGNKLKLAAARMGMEQSQRGAQQAEARRQAFAASGGDRNAYRNALQRIGDFAGVQELDASDLKSRETEADIGLKGAQAKKADFDIQSKQLEMAEKRINIMGQSSKYLMDNPTLEGAMQVTQYLMDNGVIDQGMAQKTIAELQANPTPEYIRQRAEQAFRTALGAKEQLEAHISQIRGGTTAVVGVDPVTGKARDVQSAQITQSADNAASNARQAADAAAGRAVTMRGQNLTDARARDRLNIESGAAVADAGGPSQAAFTKRFGKAPAGYRWKEDGSMESIPGGPTDRKTNEQMAGKETVDTVVAGLRSAYDSLNKNDGITSTGKGPLTNIGAAVSRSGIGQVVGGALGSKNQKERDSIAQARPLLLQAIMKATGMSAKQMDSNAELKLYLATATDPTLTLEANREALDRIEQLYGSGALQAAPAKPNGDKPSGGVVDFGSLK